MREEGGAILLLGEWLRLTLLIVEIVAGGLVMLGGMMGPCWA